jgi:F420-0:gamma-glutamyl ligase
MKFIKVKTRAFRPPKDKIWDELYKLKLKEGDILVITSKILAIHQGRCIKISENINKQDLIKREAQYYVWSKHAVSGRKFLITIKESTMLSSSGIDESNSDGHYVLWPKNITKLLKQIHSRLTQKFRIQNLGLITTDTHSMPLRRGTIGISIGFYGFEPHYDYRGKPDIFGRMLKFTVTNIVDSLAAISVHLMGEGREQTPLLIIRDAKVAFTLKSNRSSLLVPIKKDLYYPLLKVFKKR